MATPMALYPSSLSCVGCFKPFVIAAHALCLLPCAIAVVLMSAMLRVRDARLVLAVVWIVTTVLLPRIMRPSGRKV